MQLPFRFSTGELYVFWNAVLNTCFMVNILFHRLLTSTCKKAPGMAKDPPFSLKCRSSREPSSPQYRVCRILKSWKLMKLQDKEKSCASWQCVERERERERFSAEGLKCHYNIRVKTWLVVLPGSSTDLLQCHKKARTIWHKGQLESAMASRVCWPCKLPHAASSRNGVFPFCGVSLRSIQNVARQAFITPAKSWHTRWQAGCSRIPFMGQLLQKLKPLTAY